MDTGSGPGHAYQGRDDRVGGLRKIPPTPFTKGVRGGGMTGGGRFNNQFAYGVYSVVSSFGGWHQRQP